MYRVRGYAEHEIELIANRLLSNKALLLEDMAHKELGIIPGQMEDPLGNAMVMGVCYGLGGAVPVTPYLLLPITQAMPVSIISSLVVLFLFGGLKGRVVKQVWWRSGLEMLVVAGAAATVGFFIGQLADRWIVSR